MKIETQLISFLVFLLFGMALGLIDSTLHGKKKKLCYILFPLFTVAFMFGLYHINGGQIHLYFLTTFAIGLLTSKIGVKYIKKLLHRLKAKCKR